MFDIIKKRDLYYIHYSDNVLYKLGCLFLLVITIYTGNLFCCICFLYSTYKWFEIFKKYYYKKDVKIKYFEINPSEIIFHVKNAENLIMDYNSINKIIIHENEKVAYETDSYILEIQFNNKSESFKIELTDVRSLYLLYKYLHNFVPIDIMSSDKFKEYFFDYEHRMLIVNTLVIGMLLFGIIVIIMFC